MRFLFVLSIVFKVIIICQGLNFYRAISVAKVGYGWKKFLLVWVGGGVFSNIILYLHDTYTGSEVPRLGASGSLWTVLVFSMLYMGHLLGGREKALWTSLAIFFVMFEFAYRLMNVTEDGLVVMALYITALSMALGDKKIPFYRRPIYFLPIWLPLLMQLYETYISAVGMDHDSSRVGHDCHSLGGLAGIIFFLILDPIEPGPSITSQSDLSGASTKRQGRKPTATNNNNSSTSNNDDVSTKTQIESMLSDDNPHPSPLIRRQTTRSQARSASLKRLRKLASIDLTNHTANSRLPDDARKDLSEEGRNSMFPKVDRSSLYIYKSAIGLFAGMVVLIMAAERLDLIKN